MKRVISFASTAILVCAASSFAQPPAGQKVTLATSLQRGYAGIKALNSTAAAEKMPEADYSFKPGSTPEARTYLQVPSSRTSRRASSASARRSPAWRIR